jgi:hypothetical protein
VILPPLVFPLKKPMLGTCWEPLLSRVYIAGV